MRGAAPIPILLLMLAACAPVADPPSLAPRPGELMREVPRPVPVAAAADPTVLARIAALVAEARSGDAAFERVLARRSAIASGLRAGNGSEAWIVAQTQLSALEASRRATTAALAEIDRIALTEAAAAEAGTGGGARDEAAAARDAVIAIADRQNAAIEALSR